MSHSLLNAERNTHIKVMAVALVSAIAFVAVGLIARGDNYETGIVRVHTDAPVLKVGKSVTVTASHGSRVW